MNLSQTYSTPNTQLAQQTAPAAAAATPATPAPAPAPAAGSGAGDPATNAALKKKWCVENVEATFFNPASGENAGAPKSALEQFSTFVNKICPQLEAEVPSKYRTFQQK